MCAAEDVFSISPLRVDQFVARPAHAAARETGPLDERVGDMRSVRGRVLGAAALAPTGARTHAIGRSVSRWLTGSADVRLPSLVGLETVLTLVNAVNTSTPISTGSVESCMTAKPRRPKPTRALRSFS